MTRLPMHVDRFRYAMCTNIVLLHALGSVLFCFVFVCSHQHDRGWGGSRIIFDRQTVATQTELYLLVYVSASAYYLSGEIARWESSKPDSPRLVRIARRKVFVRAFSPARCEFADLGRHLSSDSGTRTGSDSRTAALIVLHTYNNCTHVRTLSISDKLRWLF